jgi:hypothetical protein
MEKKVITIIAAMILVILLVNIVSADFWGCFNKGEKIDFCNPKVNDRTAPSDGYSVCFKDYNETRECYNQGTLSKCNRAGGCSYLGGNSTLDANPPELVVNSPAQDGLYTSRSVLIDLGLDERSDIYYYDNIYGRNRWTRICNDCNAGDPAYSRKRSFKEGFNNLTFRAVDVVGNEVNFTRTFVVDSRVPRIHRTQPRSGYASGVFEVQYTEDNLKVATLFYGNEDTGMREVNLTGCESGSKEWCDVDVDLSDYNNQKIEYYFILEDIAGNIKKSQMRRNLKVDTVFPVLNNPDSFWSQGAGRYSRYIYFEFNVSEENLDEISYTYLDSRNRTRERRLCSRLRNGICETKKSFRKGEHDLGIMIIDKAGNAIGDSIEFVVDY